MTLDTITMTTPTAPNDLIHLDELIAAGMPPSFERAVAEATWAFNLALSTFYPEVTGGDTALVDEPYNAVALWLCESQQLPRDVAALTLPTVALEHATDPARFARTLTLALHAAQTVLHAAYPAVAAPSAQVQHYMRNVLAEMLCFNYPH